MTMALSRLKRRREFLKVADSRNKAVSPGLVLQGMARGDGDDTIRVGFTASRRVGGAVARNRARRRLRAAAREIIPGQGHPGWDYVLIARKGTPTRAYPALMADLSAALERMGRGATGPRNRRTA
jgi:ribonuclease P protein component